MPPCVAMRRAPSDDEALRIIRPMRPGGLKCRGDVQILIWGVESRTTIPRSAQNARQTLPICVSGEPTRQIGCESVPGEPPPIVSASRDWGGLTRGIPPPIRSFEFVQFAGRGVRLDK